MIECGCGFVESYNNRAVNTIAAGMCCFRSRFSPDEQTQYTRASLRRAIYVATGVFQVIHVKPALISLLSKEHTVPVSLTFRSSREI